MPIWTLFSDIQGKRLTENNNDRQQSTGHAQWMGPWAGPRSQMKMHYLHKLEMHKKYKADNVSHLRINFIVMLLSSHPPADNMIPNCVSKGEKVIARCSNISIFHKSVVEMPVERFLHVCNIFHRCNPADTNLLSFFMIGDWIGRHGADHWLWIRAKMLVPTACLHQGPNPRLRVFMWPWPSRTFPFRSDGLDGVFLFALKKINLF